MIVIQSILYSYSDYCNVIWHYFYFPTLFINFAKLRDNHQWLLTWRVTKCKFCAREHTISIQWLGIRNYNFYIAWYYLDLTQYANLELDLLHAVIIKWCSSTGVIMYFTNQIFDCARIDRMQKCIRFLT